MVPGVRSAGTCGSSRLRAFLRSTSDLHTLPIRLPTFHRLARLLDLLQHSLIPHVRPRRHIGRLLLERDRVFFYACRCVSNCAGSLRERRNLGVGKAREAAYRLIS